MIRWLLNANMVKAYVVSTISYFAPILIAAIALTLYFGSAGASVQEVNRQARAVAVDGQVETSKITARPDYTDYTLALAACVMLIAIGGGSFTRLTMGRSATEITNEMVEDARAAAGGDLRVGRQSTIGNEYGQLQNSFARMLDSFRQTISEIDTAADDLRRSAIEMAHTSDEAGHAIGEVAQAIGSISEGAGHQVDLVRGASDAVALIEGSIRDTSEHAREAELQSVETKRLAEQGAERAEEVQTAMQQIRTSSLHTAEVVRSLGQKSADIDQIVQAIAGIAGQTNMLALNASIEAARAGEQGKGFANVAEEVRLLAEEAHGSAEEIGRLVVEIQAQTRQAVGAMETGVERVESGFDTISRNRRTFADIGRAVDALQSSASEITLLADGIAAGTGQVRAQIEQVASVADDSSNSTEQVSASTEETSAAAEEVSGSAQRVAQTAATLAELAGRFKLPSRDDNHRATPDDDAGENLPGT